MSPLVSKPRAEERSTQGKIAKTHYEENPVSYFFHFNLCGFSLLCFEHLWIMVGA